MSSFSADQRFGPLEYKRLSAGYHFVRAIRFHHLFAQWPVGGLMEGASYNGEMSEREESAFLAAALQLAQQSSSSGERNG